MESFASICKTLLDRKAKPITEVEMHDGDYRDELGLVVCGKCGKRRQSKIHIEFPDGVYENIVPCMCDCELDVIEKAEADAKKRTLVSEMMRYSVVDERFDISTFENWSETEKNAKYKRMGERYVEHFDELAENGTGMLLWGETGTGKTYLSSCIAHKLLEKNYSVVMTSMLRLTDTDFDDDYKDELIYRMNAVDVLILDDFGAERDTDFKLEQVYAIIDARYATKKPMIISTNLSLNEMKSATDIRKQRIYNRILESCHPVHVDCDNMRSVNARKRYFDVEALLNA